MTPPQWHHCKELLSPARGHSMPPKVESLSSDGEESHSKAAPLSFSCRCFVCRAGYRRTSGHAIAQASSALLVSRKEVFDAGSGMAEQLAVLLRVSATNPYAA